MSHQEAVMYNGKLVSAFYALTFIAISYSVVFVTWDNTTLVNIKGEIIWFNFPYLLVKHCRMI